MERRTNPYLITLETDGRMHTRDCGCWQCLERERRKIEEKKERKGRMTKAEIEEMRRDTARLRGAR